MAPPLDGLDLVKLALAVATGIVYGYVGIRLRRRRIEGDARLAWLLFTHWWIGLAALTLASPVITLLPRLGYVDEAFYVTYLHVVLLGLVYLLFCLLYYLAYLFTGKRKVILPIAAFYVLLYAAIVYWITALGPYFDVDKGAIDYATPASGAPLAIMVILLLGPHLVGAALYLRLYTQVEEPTQRYRIGLIAGTIIGWFGASFLSYVPVGETTLGQTEIWPIITRAIGLIAAGLVLAAYLPPAFVRERYGIARIEENPVR